MKIGDRQAWPTGVPFDPERIKISNNRRGATARNAKRKGANQSVAGSRRAIAELVARDRRLRDPFEQARLYLGRLGIPVYSWAVYHDDFGESTAKRLIAESPWVVGAETVPTRDSVMDRARAHGWAGPIDFTTSEGQPA